MSTKTKNKNTLCHDINEIEKTDWKQLREDFFKDCVITERNRGGTDFIKQIPKVNMHPHNVFEWFKTKISKYP